MSQTLHRHLSLADGGIVICVLVPSPPSLKDPFRICYDVFWTMDSTVAAKAASRDGAFSGRWLRVCLAGFVGSASLTAWTPSAVGWSDSSWTGPGFGAVFLVGVHACLAFMAGRLLTDPGSFGVWWRSALLGCLFSAGVWLFWATSVAALGMYLVIMALFHLTEFLATALTNPDNLATSSFLLNHSAAYAAAALASVTEFLVEHFFLLPESPPRWLTWSGAAVCLAGEILRKLAMFHAGSSFNHIVQVTRRSDHILVTSGVFAYARHPSYVGWYLWAVGCQVVLANPVCLIVFTVVVWKFFAERIYFEEWELLRFFGQDYLKYQRQVPVGIPFIRGYEIEDKL